jgi:HK97 family phage portal protein
VGVLSLFKPSVKAETRAEYTLADPAFARFLGLNTESSAGEVVTTSTALGLTAYFRAVSIVAGTIAGLPLKSYRRGEDDTRERVASWVDDPGGPDGPTAFEWKETLAAHLMLQGNAYGLHLYGEAGQIAGMQLLEPSAVGVKWGERPLEKVFTVQVRGGEVREYTSKDVTHFMGLSSDGLRGYAPVTIARNAIGTGLAADKAAARMYANGLLVGGIVTPEGDATEEEAEGIAEGLRRKLAGTKRAGDIAVVNRALKFSPWTMNAVDAQFLESRAFQVEEIARMTGVPKVLLAEDGASTWGSGIAELLRGMQRFTLAAYTGRIEARLSRLGDQRVFHEFDYAGLLAASPGEEIDRLAREIEVGLLTVDEGRRLLNRAPLPAGATPPEGT